MNAKTVMAIVLLGAITCPGWAVTYFENDFNGPSASLGPNLTDPNVFTVQNDQAEYTANFYPIRRGYIKTVESDYNTADFVYEITVNISGNDDYSRDMFVGIGDGESSGEGDGVPLNGVWVRFYAGQYNDGRIGLYTSQNGTGTYIAYFGGGRRFTETSGSTHKIRFSYLQSTESLVIAIDEDWDGISPFEINSDINYYLPSFMDDTNSRLFAGAGRNNSSFDDFSVTPEPTTMLILVSGGICAVLRRK